MIISVSDVHLGEKGYQEQDLQFSNFLDFLKKDALKEGGHLVLLGDIFDFWRQDSLKILENYADLIDKLFNFPDNVDIHFVVGNHDYYLSEIPKYFKKAPFKLFGFSTEIRDVYTFRFIHGYQLEVIANPYSKDMRLYESLARKLSYHVGLTGHMASGMWHAICDLTQEEGEYIGSMLKNPTSRLDGAHKAGESIIVLAQSKARQLLLGGPFDWLVYGHTHNPFIDRISRTINTGSWGRNQLRDQMVYLKIQDGVSELIQWK